MTPMPGMAPAGASPASWLPVVPLVIVAVAYLAGMVATDAALAWPLRRRMRVASAPV